MSFNGKNPKVSWLNLDPQSADPSSPNEGDLQYADGTARAEGVYIYKNGSWTELLTSTNGSLSVVTKTSNYNIATSDDVILCDSSGAGFSLTLPPVSSSPFKFYTVRKIQNDFNTVTITPDGGDSFEEGSDIELSTVKESAQFISNGSLWYVLHRSVGTKRAIVQYKVSSGSNGGTATSGSYQTRQLNYSKDPYGILSLATNTITLLQAGYYRVSIDCTLCQVGAARAILKNTSDNTTAVLGSSCFTQAGAAFTVSSYGEDEFNISSSKNFQLQYFCASNFTNFGLGRPASSGEDEVYATVIIDLLS